MFSHVVLGADDLDAALAFYNATMGALGHAPGRRDAIGRLVWEGDDGGGGARLVVRHPLDGQPATPANGGTLGFAAPSPQSVDAWHAAGLAHGGTAIEDPPGIRHATENRTLYLAYLRDPAGNKLCAFHRVS